MHPMLNIAVAAARAAGSVIVRYLDRVDTLDVATKHMNEFVTQVDREAEAIIIADIRKAYPNHAILAEESGAAGDSEYRWIIDPLDGTTNYLHGFPQFCVSIALEHRGRLDQGVVFDPLRQELFVASRGAGARLDDRRIRVSRQSGLEGSLLGTGFPFRGAYDLDTYLETMRALVPKSAGVRRAGAAALDLAYVAAGRLDGFWEFGLQPWDMAAGVLLIREAGGLVTDADGDEHYMASGNIVTGTPKVLRELVKVIKPVWKARAS
ncbi:MAG: inositol monophosphatase family protein [Gammaproteobacteria bacterium]|nr:MAG: inositol monophosphatase family protein [Gammaproteobacteria bacterium]